MDTTARHWLILLCALGLVACGPDDATEERRYQTPASICEGGPAERTLSIDTDARAIGPSANAFVRTPDELWIVASGDNTVSTVSGGRTIDVGNERNPYDAAYDAQRDRLYITNYLTDSVTVADATTGEVLEELEHESLDRPAGVATSGRYIYVTNTGYRPEGPFADGSVTVIDPSTLDVLGDISTREANPQFATWADTSAGERLIVVNTGQLVYEGGDFSAAPSAVEFWQETPDPLNPAKLVAELDVVQDPDVGAPGDVVITNDGDRAYLTSATAPVLFELNLETGEWIRGPQNPIELYASEGDALDHAALGNDGILYISSFNTQQLLLLDTRCNALIGSFDISTNDTLNAGPHAIAIDRSDEDTAHGYIVGSISNSLIEFTIE